MRVGFNKLSVGTFGKKPNVCFGKRAPQHPNNRRSEHNIANGTKPNNKNALHDEQI